MDQLNSTKFVFIGRFGLPILCLVVITTVYYVIMTQNGALEVAHLKHLQQTFYQYWNVTRNLHRNRTTATENTLEWLNRSTSVGYRYYGDGTCRDNPARKGFMKLLKKWTELAKEYKIRYFLDAGM